MVYDEITKRWVILGKGKNVQGQLYAQMRAAYMKGVSPQEIRCRFRKQIKATGCKRGRKSITSGGRAKTYYPGAVINSKPGLR